AVTEENPAELNTRRPRAPATPPTAEEMLRELARQLYQIGERCRQAGDLDMAANCYEEAGRLCPALARQAQAGLRKVQALRAAKASPDTGEEAQELPALPPEWGSSPPRPDKLIYETDRLRLAETRKLYLVGERCRRLGDLDMAYRWYEEAHGWCPHCAYGRKALERMRQIERQRGEGSGEEQEPPKKQSRKRRGVVELVPVLPEIDPLVVPAFNRLLAETSEMRPAGLVIVEEERSSAGDEEESESHYPPFFSGAVVSPNLLVTPAVRDLVVREQQGDYPQSEAAGTGHDLSDWFREAVRTLRGVGSLRIEAGRLGHLLSGGESAVRELGCALVHEGGRCYVVYPAPSR
ncbi:MAG: hypothetical protein L0Z62_44395, partial [Gemmataceae bacterium]|nr:hypothetical protein [Gemmataceae bacterium]